MDTELSNQILIMAVTSALLQLTTTCVVWLVLHVLKFYRPFWSRSLAIETDNWVKSIQYINFTLSLRTVTRMSFKVYPFVIPIGIRFEYFGFDFRVFFSNPMTSSVFIGPPDYNL